MLPGRITRQCEAWTSSARRPINLERAKVQGSGSVFRSVAELSPGATSSLKYLE